MRWPVDRRTPPVALTAITAVKALLCLRQSRREGVPSMRAKLRWGYQPTSSTVVQHKVNLLAEKKKIVLLNREKSTRVCPGEMYSKTSSCKATITLQL